MYNRILNNYGLYKMIKCVTCKKYKVNDKFWASQQKFRSPRCKKCMNASIKKYQKNNPEKRKESIKKWDNANLDKCRIKNLKSKKKPVSNLFIC